MTSVQQVLARLGSLPLERRQAALALLAKRGSEFGVFPLSPAQHRLWFLASLYGSSPIYNVPYAFRLTGAVDPAALEEALRGLIRRHAMLRTAFFDVDGDPYQLVLRDVPFTLVRGAADAERIGALLDAEAVRAFDLRKAPLLRASLVDLRDGSSLLLLSLHHVVCDGWSMGVIFADLEELYAAARAGREPELAPLPLRYVDYVRWELSESRSEARQERLQYWLDHLTGAPELLALPTDRPRPPVQSFKGSYELVQWSRDLNRALDAFCRAEGVTTFMVLLAAFVTLLHRSSGHEDVVVGVPFANRGRPELEGIVGFFVNTLALRFRPSGGMTFRELLRQVRDVTVAGQANQDVPFETVVLALRQGRSRSHHPVFQVSFAVQADDTEALRLPGLSVEVVYADTGTAKFDLTLAFIPLEQGLKGMLEYDGALFDAATARRLLDELRALVTAAVEAPERTLAELPLQPTEELDAAPR